MQSYTADYYSGLNNWEGIYIGEWNTHIVAHSNSKVIGMTTRKGDSLKALQDAMTQRNVCMMPVLLSPLPPVNLFYPCTALYLIQMEKQSLDM